MSDEQAYTLMRESLDSLRRSGLLTSEIALTRDTVLLGTGSPLDSMAFVTFITDLEDRLNRTTGKELYLVLSEIHEFNHDHAALSSDTLARHIAAIATRA